LYACLPPCLRGFAVAQQSRIGGRIENDKGDCAAGKCKALHQKTKSKSAKKKTKTGRTRREENKQTNNKKKEQSWKKKNAQGRKTEISKTEIRAERPFFFLRLFVRLFWREGERRRGELGTSTTSSLFPR
jgi:hypothetical protein